MKIQAIKRTISISLLLIIALLNAFSHIGTRFPSGEKVAYKEILITASWLWR
ncbi:MAG: hypothetical protein MUF36_04765 [Bacteroidales bacterium]|nr:hypothetical protein [Bacteroidales bacterium]